MTIWVAVFGEPGEHGCCCPLPRHEPHPVTKPHLARTADEAVEVAETEGYPVVLKIHSPQITHKTDVGGVQLNLKDADAVRAAFERVRAGGVEQLEAWALRVLDAESLKQVFGED